MTPIDRLELTARHPGGMRALVAGLVLLGLALNLVLMAGLFAVTEESRSSAVFDRSQCGLERPMGACSPPGLALPPMEQVVATRTRWNAERWLAPLRDDPASGALLRSPPAVNAASMAWLENRGDLEVLKAERTLPLAAAWEPWNAWELEEAGEAPLAARIRELIPRIEAEHQWLLEQEQRRRERVLARWWAEVEASERAIRPVVPSRAALAHPLVLPLGLAALVLALFSLVMLARWRWIRPVSVVVDAHRVQFGHQRVPLHDCVRLDPGSRGPGQLLLDDGSWIALPEGYRLSERETDLLVEALLAGMERARRTEDRSDDLARLAMLRANP